MKITFTILLFSFCCKGYSQQNYVVHWDVPPLSDAVETFVIQKSTDAKTWDGITSITPVKDSTAYNIPIPTFSNNYVKVVAISKDTTWSSGVIKIPNNPPVVHVNNSQKVTIP